jgi:hypothetical protein
MEYINKKWDLPTMEKRMENLKTAIDSDTVDATIKYYDDIADNRLDALYLAYYHLKDIYCKVKRRTFGNPKIVEYNRKVKASEWYVSGTNGNSVWWSPSNYTWTITTSYAASDTSTTYSYNTYYNQL